MRERERANAREGKEIFIYIFLLLFFLKQHEMNEMLAVQREAEEEEMRIGMSVFSYLCLKYSGIFTQVKRFIENPLILWQ